MQHHILVARSEDAEAIAQLIDVLGHELNSIHIAGRIEIYRNDFSRGFVASNDAGLVGFLSFHAMPLFHDAEMLGRITAIAIDRSHQREGIGSYLVKSTEDFAISVGCSRMEVTSGDRREQDAHLFCAARGYSSDCRRFLKHLTNTEQDGGGNSAALRALPEAFSTTYESAVERDDNSWSPKLFPSQSLRRILSGKSE